jgi:hypothetical protein
MPLTIDNFPQFQNFQVDETRLNSAGSFQIAPDPLNFTSTVCPSHFKREEESRVRQDQKRLLKMQFLLQQQGFALS